MVHEVCHVVVLQAQMELSPRIYSRVAAGHHLLVIEKHAIHVLVYLREVRLVHLHSQEHALIVGNVSKEVAHSTHHIVGTTRPLVNNLCMEYTQPSQ